MNEIERTFFEKFNIPPAVKKGETYFTSNFRFSEHTAENDIYHEINADLILMLEQVFLKINDRVSLIVTHVDNEYEYVIEEADNKQEDYHHFICSVHSTTRKDALLNMLIYYCYVDRVFNGVREVFNLPLMENPNRRD